MKTYYEPEPQHHAFLRTARNWFIALMMAALLCLSTASDIKDAERMVEFKADAQHQAQHEAAVNAKARAIAEQMLAEGNAEGNTK